MFTTFGRLRRAISTRVLRRRSPVDNAPPSIESQVGDMVRRSAAWGPPPTIADPISQPCTHDQCLEPQYERWLEVFDEPTGHNRKVWEWAWICSVLESKINSSNRDIRFAGFGVGTEPIVGWLASRSVAVLATDLPSDAEGASHWDEGNQHAAELSDLDPLGIARPEEFAANVSFRPVDMRMVPGDLGSFDAVWSSCAIEHLGSLEAGLDFVSRTLDHVVPGGMSVHTTELNVSHDDHTVSSGHTVVYRRSDLEQFFDELRAQGHSVEATFNLGDNPGDLHVDHPPFSGHHLKIQVGDVVTTSFGICITKSGC